MRQKNRKESLEVAVIWWKRQASWLRGTVVGVITGIMLIVLSLIPFNGTSLCVVIGEGEFGEDSFCAFLLFGGWVIFGVFGLIGAGVGILMSKEKHKQ